MLCGQIIMNQFTKTQSMQINARGSIHCPRPLANPKLNLFCFPYAGGSAAVYHQWHEYLPPDVQLVAVQYPGHGTRIQASPCTELETLLDDIEMTVGPLLDRPFVFFGHSMGATVAFELTRRLHRSGLTMPKHLFLSGRGAPHMPPLRDPIHHLSDKEFWDEIRSLNGTPPEILQHKELMALVLPALRADFKLIESWKHTESLLLNVPMLVFGGINDEHVPAHYLDAWAHHTTCVVQRHMFPGDHFFLHQAFPVMLKLMQEALCDA
jgi:medium-chain acyl-[acyl-carrier-protein] hydrolase